jgi:transcriptional regulator with XRE-family HTH domain
MKGSPTKMRRSDKQATSPVETPAKRVSVRSTTEVDVRIGQLIRERRLSLGQRLDDLAGALRINPHQLQKYETGENRISASRLVDCARALGVHVAWFYQTAPTGDAGSTAGHGGQVLVNDEQALIDIYRTLAPEIRGQLLSMAKLLPREFRKTGTKTKRT